METNPSRTDTERAAPRAIARWTRGAAAALAALLATAGFAAKPVPDGVERDGADAPAADAGVRELRRIVERGQHLRLTQVMLQDQTDHYNELVHTREWLLHPSEKLELKGNLFVVEEIHSGRGRVFLKLEPLPHARPVPAAADLRVEPRPDTGFEFVLLGGQSSTGADEEFVVLEFDGGAAGRTRALQEFQRSRRPAPEAGALPRLLSNTWGDRSRDGRIRHDFIEKEIEAGARLGVEVVQIDDGWQSGISSNSVRSKGKGVFSGFWATNPDFWVPDPEKFPHGLAPLAAKAAERGVSLGLWFAPDSSNEFANWERDAACVLAFHRELGIRHFKIDGVYAPTVEAHRNLRRFFDAVSAGSGGAVVFDLDVTASLRPGYYGMIDVGPLFVENRYTDRHKYWPHQTLRNLWKIAWWVDPGRLRMEFLNTSRNADKYPGDPLAPAAYPPETVFATVFFSNPLAWFEVSNLPADWFDALPPLIGLWKQLRSEMFGGTVIPIGQAPDGRSWTGFSSLSATGDSAIVLVFRELAPETDARIRLPGWPSGAATKVEVLRGAGRAAVSGEMLEVGGVAPLDFMVLRLSR